MFSRTLQFIMSKILFVCTGNICRSLSAEAVLKRFIKETQLSGQIVVDSAVITETYIGQGPDHRVLNAATKRGYDLSNAINRQIQAADFLEFDLILCMDWENMLWLQQRCPAIHQHKLMLLMRFATDHVEACVPNPHDGGPQAFTKVLVLLEDACKGVLELSKRRLSSHLAA